MNPDAAEHPLLLAMRGVSKRYGAAIALNGVDFEARTGQIHGVARRERRGQIYPDANSGGVDSPGRRADTPERQRDHPRFAARGASARHRDGASAFYPRPGGLPSRKTWRWIGPASGFGPYTAREAAAPTLARAESLGWKFDPEARVSDLSVGTQQRIEIVKALATGAELLIFDEPTAVLSPPEINELFRVLRALKKEGKAVILIAHKLAEILAVADVVTVLRRGVRVAHLPRRRYRCDAPCGAYGRRGNFHHRAHRKKRRGTRRKKQGIVSALRPPPSTLLFRCKHHGSRGIGGKRRLRG